MRIAAEKSIYKTSSNKKSVVISATFERVFEPSSKTDEADWFVLDENGRRELNLSIDNEEPIAEERSDQVIENDGIDELEEVNNTERNFIEGDFEPMMAPTQ